MKLGNSAAREKRFRLRVAKENVRIGGNVILCVYLFYENKSDVNVASKSLSPALTCPRSSESYIV